MKSKLFSFKSLCCMAIAPYAPVLLRESLTSADIEC